MLCVLLALLAPAVFIAVECYRPGGSASGPSDEVRRVTADLRYARSEASTFLTLPEWYIVYSAEEYAEFIAKQPPSQFPYFRAIAQYWRYYRSVCRATRRVYPFDSGVHLMLGVIGVSFSAENAVKGAWEVSIGRATEWLDGHATAEDAFAQQTAREYGRFMQTTPWYEFPFADKLAALWRDTPLLGWSFVRKWERRLSLSAEYGIKAVYGSLIRRATGTAYAPEDLAIHAWIEEAPDTVFDDRRVRRVKMVGPRSYVILIPRYAAFSEIVPALVHQGARFRDIAGNEEIVLTVISPGPWKPRLVEAVLVLDEPLLTSAGTRRLAIKAPVRSLAVILAELGPHGARLEHLYDY